MFLVSMVDELVDDRRFESIRDAGAVREQVAALGDIVPANVREYIEQHLERLPREDQALLEGVGLRGLGHGMSLLWTSIHAHGGVCGEASELLRFFAALRMTAFRTMVMRISCI